jgi:hypothetical protein
VVHLVVLGHSLTAMMATVPAAAAAAAAAPVEVLVVEALLLP